MKLPSAYKPDGISQVAALMGKGAALREKPLFWKSSAPWPAQKAKPDHWVSYAVVDQNWKLVANRDAKYVELYDLVTDPYEKNDLKESRPEVVGNLLEKLAKWKATLPAKPTGKVFSAERSR